jgi:hypothetical protein
VCRQCRVRPWPRFLLRRIADNDRAFDEAPYRVTRAYRLGKAARVSDPKVALTCVGNDSVRPLETITTVEHDQGERNR